MDELSDRALVTEPGFIFSRSRYSFPLVVRVIEQGKDEAGDGYLLVRTTEADPSARAMGFIPAKAVEDMGSEEGELWGLDALDEQQ